MGNNRWTVNDDNPSDNSQVANSGDELPPDKDTGRSERYQRSQRTAKTKAKEAWQGLMTKKRESNTGKKETKKQTGTTSRKPSEDKRNGANSHRAPDIALDTSDEEDIEDISDYYQETQTQTFKAKRHAHDVKSKKSEQDDLEDVVDDSPRSQRRAVNARRQAQNSRSKNSEKADADDDVEDVPKTRGRSSQQKYDMKSKKSEVSDTSKSSAQAKQSSQKSHKPQVNESDSESGSEDEENDEGEGEDDEEEDEEEDGLEGMNPSALKALLDAETVSWADEDGPAFNRATTNPPPATPVLATKRLTSTRAEVAAPYSDDEVFQDVPSNPEKGSAKRRKERPNSDQEHGQTVSPRPKKKKKNSQVTYSRPRNSEANAVRSAAGNRKAGVHKSASLSKVVNNAKKRPAKGALSALGQKRARPEEVIEWADEQDESISGDNSDIPPRHQSKRKQVEHNDDDSDDDLSQVFSDSDDTSIEIVHAGKSKKLKLTDQHPRVRQVALRAIQEIQRDVCLTNAFPDGPEKSYSFARGSLLRSAKAIGDKQLYQRLKKDQKYWIELCSIPGQRVPNLRGKIKKITDSLPLTVFDVRSGDVRKVGWLQEGLRYIYPHNYNNNTVDGTKAFNSPFFAQVLCGAFFSSPTSFGFRIIDHFKSSLPDKPDEKEIPAPMLALVSTAVFASIEDYRTSRYRAGEFRANLFLDHYQANIDILSNIKQANLPAYHALMHGLYQLACGTAAGSSSTVRTSAMTFLNTKDMSA